MNILSDLFGKKSKKQERLEPENVQEEQQGSESPTSEKQPKPKPGRTVKTEAKNNSVMENKGLRIFLSYGHDQNGELVEMIKSDLEKRGHDVWFDKNEIEHGDDWRRSITDGITGSNKVLSFLSKHATRDPGVCRDEIAIAIGVKGGNIQTLLVESEKEVKLPVNLSHLQWLDMHDWKENYATKGNSWQKWYKEKLAEIVRVVESEESIRFAGEIELLKEYLIPIQSYARINELLERGFCGREWLFEKMETWRTDPDQSSKVFVLLATAGVGKSAFAAQLAHQRGDVLIAAHFCEWNQPSHSNAINTVKSIAFQLATKLPDYRKLLLDQPGIKNLEGKNAAELFSLLISNPLQHSIGGGRERYVILIDAIDEANSENNQNELISLIANEFSKTPSWLRLLVTSRPENDVLAQLSKFNPVVIDAASAQNLDDIRLYLNNRLRQYDEQTRNKAIQSIVTHCEGMFLYAAEICNEIDDVNNPDVDINHPDKFPRGMSNLYLNSFERKFEGMDYKNDIAPVLEVLMAALVPIHTEHVSDLLNMSNRSLNNVLLKTGSFFPVTDGKVQPFHKTLLEWLANSATSNRFYINPKDADKVMGKEHARILEMLIENPESMDTANEYAIKYSLVHLYKAGMTKELQGNLVKIMDAEEQVYTKFLPALDALIEYVIKNIDFSHEKLLKNTLQLLSSKVENKQRLAYFFNRQGRTYENIGYMTTWSFVFFEKMLKVLEELVALEPGRTDFRRDLSVSFNNVGNIYKAMGEGAKALAYFEKDLKVMEELVALEPGRTDFRRDLSVSFNNVGNIYKAMGEGAKALAYFEKSLKVREELVALEPGRTDLRVDLAISHWNIYLVCSKEDELNWLTKAKTILQPMIEKGMLHGQLQQLWGLVNKAIEKFNKK